MSVRHSGLQKEVLSLYRECLRACTRFPSKALTVDGATQPALSSRAFIRGEFQRLVRGPPLPLSSSPDTTFLCLRSCLCVAVAGVLLCVCVCTCLLRCDLFFGFSVAVRVL